MSRIGRALRELLRTDEPERPPETPALRLEWLSLSRMYEPVKRIADTLDRMDARDRRRRRRPRIIECEHPELHEPWSSDIPTGTRA